MLITFSGTALPRMHETFKMVLYIRENLFTITHPPRQLVPRITNILHYYVKVLVLQQESFLFRTKLKLSKESHFA